MFAGQERGGEREAREREREKTRGPKTHLGGPVIGSFGSNLASARAKLEGWTVTDRLAKSESGQVSTLTSGDSAAGSA